MKIKSIKNFMPLYYFIFIILPVTIVLIFIFNGFFDFGRNSIKLMLKQSTQQVHSSIIEYVKDSESILDISSDELLIDFFETVPSESKEQNIIKEYSNILKTRSYIEDIYFISIDNVNNLSLKTGIFELSVTTTMQDWYIKTKNNPRTINIISTHPQNYSNMSSGNFVITLSRMVSNSNNKEVGLILVDLSISRLTELCKKSVIGDNGISILFDDKGQRIAGYGIDNDEQNNIISMILESNFTGFKRISFNEKPAIAYSDNSDLTGWRNVNIAFEEDFLKAEKIRIIIMAVSLIVWIIIALIGWKLASVAILSQISRLKASMMEAADGSLDDHPHISWPNEVSDLNDSFIKLIKRITVLMQRNMDEQRMIRMSELKALQAQINPHFLYNTLDSIVWLAEDEQKDEVVTMTLALARFFRIGLSKGRDIIYIHEEVEHVRNYLIIQTFRYIKKLQYVIDVEESLSNLRIPKLILQPIVENSLYHGIKNKDSMGLISITGKLEGNKVLFEIKDNGAGIKEDKLLSLQQNLEKRPDDGDITSFGMINVHERIQLLFGKEYGIRIFSEYDIETRVEIWLPVLKRDISDV